MAGKEAVKRPILNIELPVPSNLNPREKISYDAHNKAALKNFDEVGAILRVLDEKQEDCERRLKELEKLLKEKIKNDESSVS